MTMIDHLGHIVNTLTILNSGGERIDTEGRSEKTMNDDISVTTEEKKEWNRIGQWREK